MITLLALMMMSPGAEAHALVPGLCYSNNSEYAQHIIHILSAEDSEYRFELFSHGWIGTFSNSHEVIETVYTKLVKCPKEYVYE